MSCNGCRVLRKGCSDTCILRSSLQWIESPEAQGHATVFVAKFFGRAGMISFISAVSESQRPALFQSLLYEACGRTVNPVFGAVGLLWSGNWGVCQAAVEMVLKGGSLQPASAFLPTLSPQLPPTLAVRSQPPPYTHTSSTISFNPSLKRSPSAETITEVPIKRLKGSAHPQEPLKEASNSTSEAATCNQGHMSSLILKKASPELRHPEAGFAAKHAEARPMRMGQVHAPVPRRVRPNIVHTVSSPMVRVQSCEDEAALREESHGTIELDLTLNSHGNFADVGVWKMGSGVLMGVSSPSSFSVNSEGSVTTSDTAEYSMSCFRTLSAQGHNERKLLHLL